MKKITGTFLEECRKEEQNIRSLLSRHMPDVFNDREIDWEWCRSINKAGYCQMSSIRPWARIRITELVEFDDIMATVRHELIHAFLPFEEMHGDLFFAAKDLLERNGLNVSYGAVCIIKESAFKWLLYTDKGEKSYYIRKNGAISFVLTHQGIEIDGIRHYVKKLR